MRFNETDVFLAMRNGDWTHLGRLLSEAARGVLEEHKKTNASSMGYYSRYSNRDRELKAEMLLLPDYPLKGIFLMEHKEGSDSMLAALAKDSFIKRMDSSAFVMHMAKNNVDSLIWGLEQGWGVHLGLLQSRQHKMDWGKLHTMVKEPAHRTVVDTWLRHWSKRNPLLLRDLFQPTRTECARMIVEQSYLNATQLNVLLQDDGVRGAIQVFESLGEWGPHANMATRVQLLRPYFAQEPALQIDMPLYVEPEY